jgi:hypothetical protein
MDFTRGNYVDGGYGEPGYEQDQGEDILAPEAPPSPVGQDERRMQVRAYNYWTSLLGDRNLPSIEDIDPDSLPDFGPYSVLLDFTSGIENPGISYLGDKIALECGADVEIATLADVPSRSLLSRITDHYMQILANQAPIGFEAEFLNLNGQTVLYRGILLPFSSDDDTIDFVYGVINWKELADPQTTERLLQEIDQALQEQSKLIDSQHRPSSLREWAEAPLASADGADDDDDEVLDLGAFIRSGFASAAATPRAEFADEGEALLPGGNLDDGIEEMDFPAFAEQDEAEMGLADWLASARELAEQAAGSEDRTRHSLYAAIGRAYDFFLVSREQPDDFIELLADCGLAAQERAPMTPVVKLVFGADYDKTRLAEYATAMGHAQRVGLARGELAGFLGSAPGGLKSVVSTERQLRREETGKACDDPSREEKLARKLRKIEPRPIEAIDPDGEEFALVLIRRMPDGSIALVGEVPGDAGLIEKAARKLGA